MKQIEKTQRIRDLLLASAGDVDIDALRVYEAIAFNTLPIRKEHFLYKGARADRNLLLEMAAELKRESRPVQIQHDKEPLPIGRVFHGEVKDTGVESELRVLFFLDPTANAQATKIEAGTVDQVSVSVVPKQLLNSKSGFDYLGPDANSENRWSGIDNEGNQLGKDGVYAQMRGLANFFEMSLVGQGGAQNARIVTRDKSHFGEAYERLAASGIDPNSLVLNATATKETPMDLAALVADLTSKTADLTTAQIGLTAAQAQVTTLEASVTERDATIAQLRVDLEAAQAADAAAITAERDAAVAALSETAKTVLTKVGKLNVELPTTVADLTTLISEHSASLVITPGGTSKDTPVDLKSASAPRASAFRSAR
ncbi:hypothetical protein [Rhizobium sp. Leaf383]|uniref:hypothetical protein n=1 Tax=Rhizobium sp. Leaf383 TaxID=1736357 RepID=UPI00071276A2|nr:hypothetical protein [Rhizobium sp. Leaf383]KQS84263.1 hypothetical protein ASG58_21065 [Rhizobium sp. Leaf383]